MIIIEYKGFPLSPVEKMAEESVEEQLSELEERVWKEKKRMREMVSSLMGQYLLKGHRMLNSSCGECGVSENSNPLCSPFLSLSLSPPLYHPNISKFIVHVHLLHT